MTPDFPPWASSFQRFSRRWRTLQGPCLHQFEALFGPWLPRHLLVPTDQGVFSRQRRWPLRLVFWTFLWQIAQSGASCREAVRQAKALCLLSRRTPPPDTTSSFCQARGKLPLETIASAHEHLVRTTDSRAPRGRLWRGHRVLAIDGTCLTLADTPQNQAAFPQQNVQKPGCGFPIVRLLACFSLATGLIVAWSTGTWYQHELSLLAQLWEEFHAADVLLGDRGFGNWTVLAHCVHRRLHAVCRLNTARRLVDWRQGKRLGRQDRRVCWAKPGTRPRYLSAEAWAELPDQLELRILRVAIAVPGFRTQSVLLVTTLLDPCAYPPDALADLYLRRWRMELCLRHLKSTLQMNHLSCLTPANVQRELRMHLLMHNLLRLLLLEASARQHADLDRLSFAGALALARRFAEALLVARTGRERSHLIDSLFRTLASDAVPLRPGRREPRAIKRRHHSYALLTCHRRLFRDIPHRNRYRAQPKPPKNRSVN